MPTSIPRSETRTGLAFGLAAYGYWGLVFPVHLRVLDATAPAEVVAAQPSWAFEVLCHRVVWSLALCALLVPMRGRIPDLRAVLGDRRTVALLGGTAGLVTVNWLVFIYAASSGQLYRAGIGYFVTPIVQIALGTVFLGERLRRFQWAAIACAALGIVWLVAVAGSFPWIELALATSFGCYGLLRKRTRAGPVVGLAVETTLLAPLALGYLAWASGTGAALGIVDGGLATVVLLALTGASTALPLMWFAAAAARLPLSTVGFLQFSAPTGQFLLGVLVFGERPRESLMWVGYALIWLGAIALAGELVRSRRLAQRLRRAAAR